jgi:hypothetical protein
MDAVPLLRDKKILADGSIIEMVVWQLRRPSPHRPHGLKYRLYLGRGGKRLVLYDNETGKGDHRHFEGKEEPYRFVSLDRLLADFQRDVRRIRGG